MNLDFLILDEALDGLSEASKVQLVNVINKLSKDHQTIIISHDQLVKKSLTGNLITVLKDDATGRSTIEQSTI